MFQVNQIVRGAHAGTFVILALRTVGGVQGARKRKRILSRYARP